MMVEWCRKGWEMTLESFVHRGDRFLNFTDRNQVAAIWSADAELCMEWLEGAVNADEHRREFYSLSNYIALTSSSVRVATPHPTPTVRLGRNFSRTN
jgi:hypothetical protein